MGSNMGMPGLRRKHPTQLVLEDGLGSGWRWSLNSELSKAFLANPTRAQRCVPTDLGLYPGDQRSV